MLESPHFRIGVLGGGISGLTCAYVLSSYAKNHSSSFSIDVLESSVSVGGCLRSMSLMLPCGVEVRVDCGCHSFRTSGGIATLDLIERTGGLDRVVPASKQASSRYVFYQGRLWRMGLVSLFRLSSAWRFLFELFIPRRNANILDETILSFFSRRFGCSFSDVFAQALVSGIYAGDAGSISMQAAFPDFVRWECESRSLLWHGCKWLARSVVVSVGRSIWNMVEATGIPQRLGYKENPFQQPVPPPVGIFSEVVSDSVKEYYADALSYTFRHGMQELALGVERALQSLNSDHLKVRVKTSTKVHSIVQQGSAFDVATVTDGEVACEEYDYIIAALPSYALADVLDAGSLADGVQASILAQLRSIPFCGVDVVHAVHCVPKTEKGPPALEGFGYLSPATAQATRDPAMRHVLGVMFNSSAFPMRYSPDPLRRILAYSIMLSSVPQSTVGVGKELRDAARCAEEALRLVVSTPLAYDWNHFHWDRAIPQYELGHSDLVQSLRTAIQSQFGNRVFLCGYSYDGVAVNQAVLSGKAAASAVLSDINRNAK